MSRMAPRRVLVGSALLVALARCCAAELTVPRPITRTVTRITMPPPAWPNDGAVDHPVASTGCGKAPATVPGTTGRETVTVNPATDEGYTTRGYWIHVPREYSAAQPTALVLVFHGGGGTALGARSSTGFSPFADAHGFLVVYPQGLPFRAIGANFTTWAATGPLDSIASGVDDLLFVSNLLDAVQQRYCVDPRRIYANGFSAGGAMTAFLTCGLTGRIAAFAPMSGDAYQFQGGCPRPHPTSILEFHGAADPAELYAGIPAREDPDWRRMGVLEWLTTLGHPRRLRRRSASLPANRRSPRRAVDRLPLRRSRRALPHHGAWPRLAAARSMGRARSQLIWRFFQAHPLRTS